ncbi:hypothetical protein [uncultured Roseobacter sp.]|uniref:hypothetical protein n=1 Tax=uncultured Roseobacter sp. TaxID=114847 RepID=UPI00261F7D86|nr:hypothetical protein [uncultured Roseobacter sp.]
MTSHVGKKQVLIHIGPHKTGSSAIQRSLGQLSDALTKLGICYLHSSVTHQVALDFANQRYEQAEQGLSAIAASITDLQQDTVLLSHEDFCGHLIGRTKRGAVYPKLTRNLRVMRRALRPHAVRFVFFRREEQDWLKSCYHQHLKYRTRFHRQDDFFTQFGTDLCWTQKLQKPKEAFGDALVVLEYQADPKAGIAGLLGQLPREVASAIRISAVERVNRSPTEAQIAQLERINEMSEFPATAWFAKSRVLKGAPSALPPSTETDAPPWPSTPDAPDGCALPALWQRSSSRISRQNVADILPPATVDLEQLAAERLPGDVPMPDLHRADIRNQSAILDYHLRGKSRLSHLNGLTISYLRRDTPHTKKARHLFHRIWREQGWVLINELSTRWLISTLQTFLDHGENEAQRMIGTAGYFYGNMVKIYEGERAIEGLEQDGRYATLTPQTKNRFRGMDRYRVGGSDLMLNTNALALDIAARDPVAGLVLQEFLLRVKSSGNVFSRHDATRQEQKVSMPGFANAWAFFEPWDD